MSTNESNKENQEVKTVALTDLTVENDEQVKGGAETGFAYAALTVGGCSRQTVVNNSAASLNITGTISD